MKIGHFKGRIMVSSQGEYPANISGIIVLVPAKVCSVKLMDAQGRPEITPVLAHSRNGAAALALEELIKQRRWSRDGSCKIEVTVHEPGPTYEVTLDQILKWANRRERGEPIGVVALKKRILDLFAQL
ncbi:MAG: hypothetical protein WAM39_13215 [Bryobacteraceae bacterium]